MKTKSKTTLVLLIIAIISLGYFREHLFLGVNLRIQQIYYNTNENIDLIPTWVKIISNFSYSELIKLKWILTFLFVLFYWGIGVTILKICYIESKLIKQHTYSILGLLVFSLVIFYIGDEIFGKEYMGYEIARFITGFLQSPLPTLISFSLFYSQKKQGEK